MKNSLLVFLILLLTACAPAVPYDAVSPETDLYSDAQSKRSTAQAALQEAQIREQFLTATAQAPIVHITETAAGLIVAQTRGSIDLTSTAVLWTATPSPMPTITSTPTPNATSTAVFAILNAEGTQIANNLERDRLELERQTTMNDFNAKVVAYSWMIVVLVLIVAVMLIVRKHRYQPATVDARGNVLPVIDVISGTVTDVDRNPNYQGSLHPNVAQRLIETKLGLQPLLPVVTAERQDATTERDQMTDLATRGLPADPGVKERKQLAGQQAMKQMSAPNMQSRFKILDAETTDLGVINGEIIQVLDQDWQEANRK